MTAVPVLDRLRRYVDAWHNPATGAGGVSDKWAQATFVTSALSDSQLEGLFEGEALAHRIVTARPKGALSAGPPIIRSVADPDTAGRLSGWYTADRVGVLFEGLVCAGLYGNGLLVPYEGQFLSIEKPYVSPVALDVRAIPTGYRVTYVSGGTEEFGSNRAIRIPGVTTLVRTRSRRNGWDSSELQRAISVIQSVGQSWQGVLNLLATASQGVFSMRDLHAALSNDAYAGVVERRLALLELERSSQRSIAIDAEDSFSYVERSFAGVADTLDRALLLVSMATDGIPVTVLYGRSPAGMNATGESDIEGWHSQLEAYRQQRVSPVVERMLPWVAQWTGSYVPSDVTIEWPPLRTRSANEKAQEASTWASALSALVTANVIDPVTQAEPKAREILSLAEDTITEELGETVDLGVVGNKATITVNEVRAKRSQGPLLLPDGTPDPRGSMTVSQFETAIAVAEQQSVTAPPTAQ